jgi:hypothetical protein
MHSPFSCFALALLLPAALPAATHEIVPKVYYRTFSHTNPVMLRIRPRDVVITKTVDSSGRDFTGEVRHSDPGNPLTGPFFIEGRRTRRWAGRTFCENCV